MSHSLSKTFSHFHGGQRGNWQLSPRRKCEKFRERCLWLSLQFSGKVKVASVKDLFILQMPTENVLEIIFIYILSKKDLEILN